MHQIVFQCRIGRLWILLGGEQFFIDSDQFLSFAGFLAETVIGNAIKPGGKLRFATKPADVFVSANKCVLGQIIGKCEIAAGKLSQQTSHARLMTTDQLAKGVLVVINKNSGDKAGIG